MIRPIGREKKRLCLTDLDRERERLCKTDWQREEERKIGYMRLIGIERERQNKNKNGSCKGDMKRERK